jgi:exodeoxyribonuclease V alpha subunit
MSDAGASTRYTWPPGWARGLIAEADVDPAALYLAIEAGTWPDLSAAERRAFTLLVLASIDARAEGATRLRLDATDARLSRLGAGDSDRAELARLLPLLLDHPALRPFLGRPGDHKPFVVEGDFLYQERDLRLEQRLAQALGARVRAAEIPIAPAALAAAIEAAAGGRRWAGSQADAIAAALRRPLAVITGGPGTGKTALIDGIVRGWKALGIPADAIAIAAPTGKAANRIAEVLPEGTAAPRTLHRLLGMGAGRPSVRTGEFRHHENRPLPYAAVVVDEASMVDLALMERLLRALRPDARLVLIGDADQLPAVEAGSVFRDLGAFALRLTESHRMDPTDPSGAAILEIARGISAGQLPRSAGGSVSKPAELPFSGFAFLEHGSAPAALAAFVEHWYATWLRPDGHEAVADGLRTTFQLRQDAQQTQAAEGAFEPRDAARVAAIVDHHRRVRLLAVTRSGPTGSRRLNAALARRMARDAGVRVGADELAAGTPVMMIRNDYDRGLFNGDQGVVVRVRGPAGAPPLLAAAFWRLGALVAFPLVTLRGVLETAYASTVHKAQGSELDHAALVLPDLPADADMPLACRELVYTAVTRARRSITVLGPRELLERAIARPLERSSGLADRLKLPSTS